MTPKIVNVTISGEATGLNWPRSCASRTSLISALWYLRRWLRICMIRELPSCDSSRENTNASRALAAVVSTRSMISRRSVSAGEWCSARMRCMPSS